MIHTDPRVESFAKQFLTSAKLSVNLGPTDSRIIQFGSRQVSIFVPQAHYVHGLHPLLGLREAEAGQSETGDADFQIIFFQNTEGARLPTAFWPSDQHYPLGQLPQRLTGRYRVAIDRHTGTVSVMDLSDKICGVWAYEAQRMAYWWCATPFRLQFSWIADTFDGELVHAAAVSMDKKTTLVSGMSGAGKSTLSHLLGRSGAQIISDDFVLIQAGQVSSPYLRTKLHSDSLQLMPWLRPKVQNPSADSEKKILNGVAWENSSAQPLKQIVSVNRKTQKGMALIERSQVFHELAVGTISGVLGGNRRSLQRIAALAKSVDCFSFDPPDDINEAAMQWRRDE